MRETGSPRPPTDDPPTRAAERPALAHVPALDGLRGLAVAAVLAFHAGRLTGGWLGVDAFFVLSGYLITSLLLVDRMRLGRIRLRRFWARRVRRLGPALVITITATALLVAVRSDAHQRHRFRWDGLATLFEVMNWRSIAAASDYWSEWSAPSPLRHAWSLSIEEQVYVLWPLVVLIALALSDRARTIAVTAWIGAIASIIVMFRLEAIGADTNRLYLGTDTRVAAVLLGAAVAAHRIHLGPRRWHATRPVRIAVGTAAMLPLLVLWIVLDGSDRSTYRGWLALAGVLATLVIASLTDRADGGPLGRLLSHPALVHLGRISYGLYLYHWPVYLLLAERPDRMDGPRLAIAVTVSYLLAAASHRWIESPVRLGALRGRIGRAAVPAGLAIAILAILTATLDARPRTTDWDRFLARSADPSAPTVLYAGDSVPLLLAETAAGQVDELGVNVGSVAVAGCNILHPEGPLRDIGGRVWEDAGCGEPGRFREGALAYRPDVSLLLFGRIHNNAVEIDGRWRLPCDPEFDAAYRRHTERVVDELTAGGAPVVLVSSPGTTVEWVIDAVPPGMAERYRCLNDLLREIADHRPDVGFVDLDAWICPEPGRCLEEIDGIDLRPDTVHFEGRSAELVNRWLIPRVLAVAADDP